MFVANLRCQLAGQNQRNLKRTATALRVARETPRRAAAAEYKRLGLGPAGLVAACGTVTTGHCDRRDRRRGRRLGHAHLLSETKYYDSLPQRVSANARHSTLFSTAISITNNGRALPEITRQYHGQTTKKSWQLKLVGTNVSPSKFV
jgi:hypothetical protein